AMGELPRILDYRGAIPKAVSQVRFGRVVTLLLLANTVLAGAMVLSVFFIDRLGLAGGLMIAAGTGWLVGSFGCLTSDQPNFKLALVLGAAALSLTTAALALNWNAASELEAAILLKH